MSDIKRNPYICSQFPNDDSCNRFIDIAIYLEIMLTKSFNILQCVVESQKVHISKKAVWIFCPKNASY